MHPTKTPFRAHLWGLTWTVLLGFCVLIGTCTRTAASDFYVSPTGNDQDPGTQTQPWRTIQKACNAAIPGSTVYILAGTYNEKVTVNVSGSAVAGYITLTNYGTDHVIVDGTGKLGKNIFYLQDKNYIRINGLEIVNDLNVQDGSGIRLYGSGDHIALTNNTIHHITGQDAMGITVYGTRATKSISNLSIQGNLIYDCQPAHSETLTLNGNVKQFEVSNNIIHDVNNIGIDFIGGEGTCPVPQYDKARNGVCRWNTVYNARSSYGGGYAGAIYVDGGRDILIANNTVTQSDLGIEVGAEHYGRVARNVVVSDNLVYNNDKAGIVFGGYASTVGRVKYCRFTNNTLYHNDRLRTGVGEMWIQYASYCLIENNLFYCNAQDVLLFGDVGSALNTSNYNLWFAADGPGKAQFAWGGKGYASYGAYLSGSHQDAASLFADPLLVNPDGLDFHLSANSPAIDAGDPAYVPFTGEVDMDEDPRILGSRVDIGADEAR